MNYMLIPMLLNSFITKEHRKMKQKKDPLANRIASEVKDMVLKLIYYVVGTGILIE
jgi:hypothetical protein